MRAVAIQHQLVLRWTLAGAITISLVCLCSREAMSQLPISIGPIGKSLAPVFDFDGNSCYPSPAISAAGVMNPGLRPGGSVVGQCRDKEQLTTANTYYRSKSVVEKENVYSVHMYALYFKKDQAVDVLRVGHRHDWEFALLWTKNDKLTHASYSEHGKVFTKPIDALFFDPGKPNTVKVVYHKDGVSTHCFRFASKGEKAENILGKWITPALVDWDTMKSKKLDNAALKEKFNQFDYGASNCSFNDTHFEREVRKSPPQGYPF